MGKPANGTRARELAKARQALAARDLGLTWQEIAAGAGYCSPQSARRAATREARRRQVGKHEAVSLPFPGLTRRAAYLRAAAALAVVIVFRNGSLAARAVDAERRNIHRAMTRLAASCGLDVDLHG